MSLLKVENISTGYGKKQVLFDVSFEVNKGEIVLIAGSNGSGKSTLLKAIYGLLPQWGNGRIYFDGENITGKPTASLIQRGMLYIPQKNNLFEDLTVKENLEMAGLTLDKKVIKYRIEEAITTLPILTNILNRNVIHLSGGERQLLILAMASIHKPQIILYDEPFLGLAPHKIKYVMDSMKVINIQSKTTILLVEHRINEAIKLASKIIGVKDGNKINDLKIGLDFKISDLNFIFV